MSDRPESFQAAVTAQVNQLATQLQQILTRLEIPDVPTAPPPVDPAAGQAEVRSAFVPLRLASPERFSGESGNCRTFLVQCDLH